ncbi:MAG: hypothetical protein IJL03_02880 [Lachnospiraceae bacterium]|nr:hypothetical protein [Lachnospiraceae bacterium]
MSKKRVKIALVSGIAVIGLLVLAIILIVLINGKKTNETEIELSNYEKDLDFLTKEVPSHFYFYGDEIVLSDERPGLDDRLKALKREQIERLTENKLMPDGSAEHYVLVVNDQSKNATLSEADILLIDRLIRTTKYTFIYIGNRYAEDFIRLGLWNSYVGGSEFGGGVSIGFFERNLVYTPNAIDEYLMQCEGGVKDYPVKLGEMVISEVASLVRSCR